MAIPNNTGFSGFSYDVVETVTSINGFSGFSYESVRAITTNSGFSGFGIELAPIEKIKLDDDILQKGTFIDINSTRIEKNGITILGSDSIIAKNVGTNSIEYDYTIPVARPIAPYTVFVNVTYSTTAGGTTTKDIEITVN